MNSLRPINHSLIHNDYITTWRRGEGEELPLIVVITLTKIIIFGLSAANGLGGVKI